MVKKLGGHGFKKVCSFLHTSRRVFCSLTGLGGLVYKSAQNVRILCTFMIDDHSFRRLRSEVSFQSRTFSPALKGNFRSG